MSLRHARWIVEVCNMASSTPFWIYTRTLQAVPQLCVARNLGVNISADSYNYAKARSVAAVTGARMTYLTRDGSIPEDLPDDAVIFPDYNLRGRGMPDPTAHHWWLGLPQSDRKRVCPTDFFGQSEAHRCGPCDRCLTPSPTQRCTP
jgi:hypothetical protein